MENRSPVENAMKRMGVGFGYIGKVCLIAVFILPFLAPYSQAQDETAIRQVIRDRDLKKIEKADKIRSEAEKGAEEISKLKQEIRSVARDSGLNARVIRRKARFLQTKSWQKEVQISALYQKSNAGKYSVYKKYLIRFWKEHEGEESKYLNAKVMEEQARDNYSQASVYRRKTKHMNLGYAKIEKLTEANNLESVAIRRQVSSLAVCHGITGGKSLAAVPDTTSTAQNPPKAAPSVVPVKKDTATAPASVRKTAEMAPVIEQVRSPEPAAVMPATVNAEIPAGDEAAEEPPIIENHVVFRIQIAAGSNLLTFQELSKINPGNYPVEAVSEGGILKYQFIGVLFYSDAQRIFREANIKGSFIVAYRNGQKKNPAELIKENKELEIRIRNEGKPNLMETVYHVELMVSKTPLKAEEMAKLYHGSEPVLLILEKGMYKYHLNAVSLATAKTLMQQSGVAGAVIAAYKNALRLNGNDIR